MNRVNSVSHAQYTHLASCGFPGLLSSFFLTALAEESLPPRALTLLFAVFSLGAVLGRFFDDRFIRSSRYARSLSESCGKERI